MLGEEPFCVLRLLAQHLGVYPNSVLLTASHNIRYHRDVCYFQCSCKIVHKQLRSRIRKRLEHYPNSVEIKSLCRLESAGYLRRVMTVVINYRYAVHLVDLLETSYRSEEVIETIFYRLPVNSRIPRRSHRCKRIEHIVLTRNVYPQCPYELSSVIHIKCRHKTLFALYFGAVIVRLTKAERYHRLTLNTCHSLDGVPIIAVVYNCTCRHISKGAEAFYDIVKCLEIFKMIRINVQYYCRIGIKLQEMILKLTRLTDHSVALACKPRTFDAGQLSAYHAGDIPALINKYLCQH